MPKKSYGQTRAYSKMNFSTPWVIVATIFLENVLYCHIKGT